MKHIDYSLSPEDYHANGALSNSMLSRLKKSPAHLKHYLENPEPPTPAMITGTIVHTCVLEPDIFEVNFVRGPEGDRRTKAVKAEYAELEEQGIHRECILSPAAYDQCIGIRDAIYHHPIASQLLLPGYGATTEASMFWEAAGVQCRGRVDALPVEDGEYPHVIADLKSCVSAEESDFSRAAYNFGYYRQAAFYLNGFACIEDIPMPTRTDFIIVAIEKTAPYACQVFLLDDDAVELGQEEVRVLLNVYKQCLDSDEWGAYPQEVMPLALPGYAFTQ